MKTLFLSLAALPLLAACATTPLAGPAAPEGSTVALGQPVQVADIVLTPLRVTEDSRCPINARCVWAGQIIVETRVDGRGWRETLPMQLGEPAGTHGYVLNLVSAEPGRMAGTAETDPKDYRFAYEGSSPDRPLD
ncbi:hypothetical protein [Alteraurantiacibacter buctensis]|uniref:Lipoprotein n=1 Tax=Alteraurantiacibacter buctensis TaxID=1503981 RepID=A0A844YX81_9SPHN|nr:hypothetical protein [Alteraurantiacibacter buctensis]MXO71646.1 hypothetical protein [Alteraurantiacibacter buctensis]